MSQTKSRAVSSQGTRLFIQQRGAPLPAGVAITAVTRANPAVVTAAGHGLSAGQVVRVADVLGMTQLNDKTYVVANPQTDTFELQGVDASAYNLYASGGKASALSMLETVEHKSYSGFDGQASEVDTTTLVSKAKEKTLGLRDFGGMSIEINRVDDEAFQVEANLAAKDGEPRWFSLIKRNGFTKVWQGYVRSFSDTGAVDGVNGGTLSVTISGEVVDVK
ncbi:ubiquitin-activating E1 FCCH domain-containing protein [Pseudomonas sp. RIT-PI-AD]|uniref:ubiquitin-activating E1 FCCH domain-containing protein n=1 Tax=Pseudomonas sp. RIT-PI-AD TaxID=3035294 RepID=UPI0021D8F1C7|nr:ubiquitin-activating E1 FCCH domain-containing protein [Pseudomonas sp. RIT-PI-AD]